MDNLPALITSITALVTALGGLIALFRHVGKPADVAHSTPTLVPLSNANPTTAIQQAPPTPPAV